MASTGNTFSRAAKNTLATIGAITVAVGAGALIFQRRNQSKAAQLRKLPSEFILDLDFQDIDVVEKASPWKALPFAGGTPQIELRKLIEILKDASEDDRIKGLFTSVGAQQQFSGLAQVQEIRQSLVNFRDKKGGSAMTVAYADSFGEGGQRGLTPYYLASASDKVYMQPTGYLSITGLATQTNFVRGLLDSFNIKPIFFTREAYKNFPNQYTHETYSGPHREATGAILSSWMTQIVAGIAQSRGLPAKQVRDTIDQAPLSVEKAIASQLLDGSKYRDQAIDTLPKKSEDKDKALPRVTVTKYITSVDAAKKREKNTRKEMQEILAEASDEKEKEAAEKSRKDTKPTIAVMTCVGPILAHKVEGGPPSSNPEIISKSVVKELEKIRKNESIKAVVLRVDSPGGSAVGSDTIYRQILRIREAGKPVIVSMGNVAGSGGYYIAAPATKIVANPATITGSIGVVTGKFNLDAPARKYGVNVESITEGKNSDAWSAFSDFTEDQIAQLQESLDEIYLGFLERVAKGRGKPVEEVRKIAGGRIWSGSDALKVGLVDKLGGIQEAIELAKQEAGLPLDDEDKVQVVDYPRIRSPLALVLLKVLGKDVSVEGSPSPSIFQQFSSYILGGGTSEIAMLEQAARQARSAIENRGGHQLIVPELTDTKIV